VTATNEALVRSICEAWERGDWSSAEWAAPEIEFVVAGDVPASGKWTGLADISEAMRDLLNPWAEVRLEVEEYRALDAERILVLGRFTGRGKTSGLDLGQIRPPSAFVFHIRSGKVITVVYYTYREHASADLDLVLETDSPHR
jgi:ketosteroid isomerase-like protein